MRKFNKKGLSLSDLPNVALVFLLIGVFFAVALVILASLSTNSSITGSADAGAAVNKTIDAVSEIPNNWLLLIAVIVAAAVVIGVVMTSMNPGGNSSR